MKLRWWLAAALCAAHGAACGGRASSAGSSGATGGAGGSAGSGPSCFDPSGQLVSAAKTCSYSADCLAIATETCCGPSTIVAMSASATAYHACYPPVSDCPAGLGCASQATTEDGMPLSDGAFTLQCVGGLCQSKLFGSGNGPTWSCACSSGLACCSLVDGGPPPR